LSQPELPVPVLIQTVCHFKVCLVNHPRYFYVLLLASLP
jgi:hypothetical protein